MLMYPKLSHRAAEAEGIDERLAVLSAVQKVPLMKHARIAHTSACLHCAIMTVRILKRG
jgi:hypothetical protein